MIFYYLKIFFKESCRSLNPNLLVKVDYDNPGQITRFKRSNDGSESYQGDSISFDDNDPMSLALQEYDKIKAN